MMNHYTVNTSGNNVTYAKECGYNAYYANNVTAIEIKSSSKSEAKRIAESMGFKVLYVFE